jgi:hypothetical protein
MEMMDAPARADKNLELSQTPVLSYLLCPFIESVSSGKRLSVSIDKLVVPSPTPPSEFINNPPSEPRPPDPPDGGGDGNLMIGETEERMPPKMRKKWMHRELEARKEPSAKASQVTLDSQGASPYFLPCFFANCECQISTASCHPHQCPHR